MFAKYKRCSFIQFVNLGTYVCEAILVDSIMVLFDRHINGHLHVCLINFVCFSSLSVPLPCYQQLFPMPSTHVSFMILSLLVMMVIKRFYHKRLDRNHKIMRYTGVCK